ncbi:hypothetical protein LTR78_001676 [Recurvomyces mirabilis]|uniref:WD40 repeat-like protein n=1 Tax=Recurvomyces mirabilis TaxID=574656 RepID=A0AAE1C552_9PEZI|nr:hypothetical protein LTR78_001676 [Recurvomyces mirabilis]KAK5151754.1 hypothetical protein LTS14_008886 [Recurvomyces mirabilis]
MAEHNGFHRLSHGHNDLVLATAFNLYGTRMATASSDHRVKVWDLHEATTQWIVTDVWTAHDAEVTDVRWNGPYVGEHISTIGEDGLLRLWEEDLTQAPGSGRRFKKVFELVSPTGVPFMSLDLKNIGTETYLAAATRDGYLIVCEPEDHDDLSAWKVLWSEYLCMTPSRAEETGFRLSWHKEKLPAWPAILAGLDRKSLSLAVAVGNVVKIFRSDHDRKLYTAAVLEGAKDLVRDVSWANGSCRGHDLITSASRDGCIRIHELHTPGAVSLPKSATITSVASRQEAGVRTPTTKATTTSGIGAGLAGARNKRKDVTAQPAGVVKQEAKLVAELSTHSGAPWRVNWSPMGDLLISSGDDGMVKVWKKAMDGKWLEAVEIDALRDI